MSLQVVYGESRNRIQASLLADQLRQVTDEGTVYLGYPVLATADETVEVDALMVSQAHGLVAFLLPDSIPRSAEEWDEAQDRQDRLYDVLDSTLSKHSALRKRRRLAVDITTVTVFPDRVEAPSSDAESSIYCDLQEVAAQIGQLPGLDAHLERAVQAALQRVTTMKPIWTSGRRQLPSRARKALSASAVWPDRAKPWSWP
jgi:hypothetical protein